MYLILFETRIHMYIRMYYIYKLKHRTEMALSALENLRQCARFGLTASEQTKLSKTAI